MEIELKYSIDDDSLISKILDDRMLTSIEERNSRDTQALKAVYFDTEEGDLKKLDVAFRIRLEGSRYIATLKRRGSSCDGLHKREEINAPVTDDEFVTEPDLSIFSGDELIEDIRHIVEGKKLVPVMEMDYVREIFKVSYHNSIIEVSVDQGDIWTSKGNVPICEMELELYSGNESELLKLGKAIQKAYNLKPENVSKLARGFQVLDGE